MKHDELDQAIDHVAARLTHVEENPALASRIVNALPERSAWSLHWLMPRLAGTAAIALGVSLVVLRTFDGGSTDVLRSTDNRSMAVQATAAAIPEYRTNVEPAPIARRTTVERSENDRRTIEALDFDRSLEAIEAPAALSLAILAPSALPEDAPLTLLPLAIAELPLTAETISPR